MFTSARTLYFFQIILFLPIFVQAQSVDSILVRLRLAEIDSLRTAKNLDAAIALGWRTDQLYKGGNTVLRGELLDEIGKLYYRAAKPDSATLALERGLAVFYALGDSTHTKSLEIRNNLSVVTLEIPDYNQVLYYAREALRLQEKLYPTDTANLVLRLHAVGRSYQYLEQHEKVLPYFQQMYDLQRTFYPEGHLNVCFAAMELGSAVSYTDVSAGTRLLRSAEKCLSDSLPANHWRVRTVRNNLARSLPQLDLYDESLYYDSLNLHIIRTHQGHYHKDVFAVLNNIGSTFINLGRYADAHRTFQEIMQYLPDNYSSLRYRAAIYDNVSLVYYYYGLTETAILYNQKSIALREEMYGPDNTSTLHALHNLASKFQHEGYHETAERYYQRAIDGYIRAYTLANSASLNMARNLAWSWIHTEQYTRADSMILTLLDTLQTVPEIRLRQQPHVERLMAQSQLQQQRYTESRRWAYRAFNNMGKLDFPSAELHLEIHNLLIETYVQEGDYRRAELQMDSLLTALDFTLDGVAYYPPDDPVRTTYLTRLGRHTLEMFKRTEQVTYLNQAEQFLRTAGEKFNRATEKLGQTALLTRQYEQYHRATAAVQAEWFQLNPTAERAEQFLLATEALRKVDEERFQTYSELLVSDSSPTRTRLQEQYNHLSERRRQLLRRQVAPTDSVFVSVVEAMFDLNKRLEKLTAGSAMQKPTATLANVRAQLPPDERMLTYLIYSDTILYTLVVDANSQSVHKQTLSEPLRETTARLLERGLLVYDVAERDRIPFEVEDAAERNYTIAARQLYQILLAPFTNGGHSRYLILPDGPLYRIPFAALLPNDPERIGKWKSYSFAVDNFEFRYAFRTHSSEKDLFPAIGEESVNAAILAPYAVSSSTVPTDWNLPPLPASKIGGEQIAKLLQTNFYDFEEARVDTFLEAMKHTPIIHLATHAFTAYGFGGDAYLMLTDSTGKTHQTVSAYKIGNRRSVQKLVVLSGCETGSGELTTTGGINSLLYAFDRAGAENTYGTLWNILDDVSTTDLVVDFYKALQHGTVPSTALTGAQRRHLATYRRLNANDDLLNPFYWGAWVGTGRNLPLFTAP